jgi:hypothetical protein
MSETAQTSAARLGIEATQMELTKHLMAEDPLPMVMRGHMHIQAELLNFVKARGLLRNEIPSKYAHLVQRAATLGLPNEFSKQLVFIGKLRNRLATISKQQYPRQMPKRSLLLTSCEITSSSTHIRTLWPR